MIATAPNSNALWGSLIVEELVRHGVDFFCTAPGSRSTPLVSAVARHPRATSLVHFDERGAAFAALGYARAAGRPAAWITTSGTAVANGFPAVVEASLDHVPILLLTADRPPELRQTGANQTIDQVKIFGDLARRFVDLPAPGSERPEFVLTTVAQAVTEMLSRPGPVHLNCMFREPLAAEPQTLREQVPHHLTDWASRSTPYTEVEAGTAPSSSLSDQAVSAAAASLRSYERGLVVAGRGLSQEAARQVQGVAAALGWPLLPDIQSGLRIGEHSAVKYYDRLLANDALRGALRPEAVVQFGAPPVSKTLSDLVLNARPEFVVVHPSTNRYDPTHVVTRRIVADPEVFAAALANELSAGSVGTKTRKWFAMWMDASIAAGAAVDGFLAGRGSISEPGIARLISNAVPENHGLVLASSMPVRDFDMFADGRQAGPRVFANRGASGIDGTIATSVGVTAATSAPTTVVLGDLALLHDLNSLDLVRRSNVPVVVTVINNDGGGIFSFLPVSQQKDVFERMFGTPHGLNFAEAAKMFELDYYCPRTADEFDVAYRETSGRKTALIEVVTNRLENRQLHSEIDIAISSAVSHLTRR